MQYRTVVTVICGCMVAQVQGRNSSVDSTQELSTECRNSSVDSSEVLSTEDRQFTSSAVEPRLGVVTNSYYDFLINEGSYKFWAVFQLVTVAILLYSTFAAIYYAKYTFLKEVESSDVDDFLIRSTRSAYEPMFLGLDPVTFQRIIDSVSSLNVR